MHVVPVLPYNACSRCIYHVRCDLTSLDHHLFKLANISTNEQDCIVQDVVYPLANLPAMAFVGGGAKNASQWFAFLGLVKDKRFPHQGAPFQMDFPSPETRLSTMTPMAEPVLPCWDAGYKCSCGDCPDAPTCIPVSFLLSRLSRCAHHGLPYVHTSGDGCCNADTRSHLLVCCWPCHVLSQT